MSIREDDTFNEWCDALDKLRYPWSSKPVTEITGRDCWRSFYNDGYAPEDALAEDISNAAD